jgi:signal transduction histidine kinase
MPAGSSLRKAVVPDMPASRKNRFASDWLRGKVQAVPFEASTEPPGLTRGYMTTRTSPTAITAGHLRLADFIRLNVEPIVVEWISFARTRSPASDSMSKLALRDHIEEILTFVADDLEMHQTKQEQVAKSRGLGPDDSPFMQSAAEVHAALRLTDGFDIDQMVSEYRALRASVVKQWIAHNQVLAKIDLEDLTRFNEAIDQAMTESVAHYTKSINHSRNLFLGVLGHDLRNPIGAATMAARFMVKRGGADPKLMLLASQIVTTTERATQILNDLLDATRLAFGTDLPVARAAMDMSELGSQLVDEMRTVSNGRAIELSIAGETEGKWDKTRIGQVLSNLIGNALQYSPENSTVHVRIAGEEEDLLISVRNDGSPISADKINGIFDPLTRGQNDNTWPRSAANLGLGLYITKKIVLAHLGDISVLSTAETGTTFIVRLPRQ